MSKENLSGWDLKKEYDASLPTFNSTNFTPGTFRQSSSLNKADRGSRPYGGPVKMSKARLTATGPRRDIVPQVESHTSRLDA
jgi:hypothetical protein